MPLRRAEKNDRKKKKLVQAIFPKNQFWIKGNSIVYGAMKIPSSANFSNQKRINHYNFTSEKTSKTGKILSVAFSPFFNFTFLTFFNLMLRTQQFSLLSYQIQSNCQEFD